MSTHFHSYLHICRKFGWDYMAVRFWVGMWTALIIFIVVATDASALLAYATRFR